MQVYLYSCDVLMCSALRFIFNDYFLFFINTCHTIKHFLKVCFPFVLILICFYSPYILLGIYPSWRKLVLKKLFSSLQNKRLRQVVSNSTSRCNRCLLTLTQSGERAAKQRLIGYHSNHVTFTGTTDGCCFGSLIRGSNRSICLWIWVAMTT